MCVPGSLKNINKKKSSYIGSSKKYEDEDQGQDENPNEGNDEKDKKGWDYLSTSSFQ